MEFLAFDLAKSEGSKRVPTDQGYISITDCVLARSGILEYKAANFQPRMYKDRNPNDIIRVYRSVQTVQDAAQNFSGAPVTVGHPKEMLNPKNTGKYQTGHVNGDVTVTDGKMIATLLITGDKGMAAINNGIEQISNGYYSQYDFQPGISPEGEHYDAEQHTIRANHVALVREGRCGYECRVSDSADDDKEPKKMANVTINGVAYEASEQVVQAVGMLQATADQAAGYAKELEGVDAKIEAAKNEVREEFKKTLDQKDAEIDALKAQIPTADQLDEMAEERQTTLNKAKHLMPKENFDGKSLDEIKRVVVLDCCKDLETLDGRSDDYIFARFDALEAPNSARDQPQQPNTGGSLRSALGGTTDAADVENLDAVEEARMKKKERDRARGRRNMDKGYGKMQDMEYGKKKKEDM